MGAPIVHRKTHIGRLVSLQTTQWRAISERSAPSVPICGVFQRIERAYGQDALASGANPPGARASGAHAGETPALPPQTLRVRALTGVDFLRSPYVLSPLPGIRTPRHPLLPVWEKGVGGMRGQTRTRGRDTRAPDPRTGGAAIVRAHQAQGSHSRVR